MGAAGGIGGSRLGFGRAGLFVYHARMSWRWIWIAGLLAGCAKSPVDKSHLIDRELFFGNPALASPQVSPDGRWVAFLKERNGILNLHLVGWGGAPDQARPLTDEKERPPAGFT